MHTCFITSKFWFMSFLLMIPILAPTSVFANDGNISTCSGRFNCGDISNVGYPFWGLDRPASCGYPGFRLNCNEDRPEITINSATYRVLDINTPAQVLKVARIDYADNICPTNLLNSTFTSSPFEHSRDTRDIRLFYGCQSLTDLAENPAQGISSQFECTVNETDMIGYYLTRDMSETSTIIRNTLGSCKYSVTIPVMTSAFPSLENVRNSDTLEEALSIGFDLRWSANDSLCNACVHSGGQCGHKLDSAEFICYCSGGSYARDCNITPQGEKKSNVGLTIGLAIAGAVIAGILLGIGIVSFKQRRSKFAAAEVKNRDLSTPPSSKEPYTSTTNLSQSIPSYPTSEYDIERGSTYFGAHVFSYEELVEATCDFNPTKQLGEGGFGTVYHGVLNDGRAVAVKRLYESNVKRVDQYMNEIEILTRIRHPNLVTLYGCTSKRSRELLLVYEYISNGTVADHLHGKLSNNSLLTWPVRLSIAVETANALAYLHASDIIHRDVKTNNILLDISFNVKVADFGLSRLFPNDVTHVSTAPQGTPGYVDPEYYQCYQLSEKSDVYSFGVVLIELISAKQAVDTNRRRDDINLANMGLSRIRNHALHELVDSSLGFENDCAVRTTVTRVAELASRCLQKERDSRPSMEEVLQILRRIEGEDLRVQKAEELTIFVHNLD